MTPQKIVRRRPGKKIDKPGTTTSPRTKKILVSWSGAEFAFGETEVEAAVLFALRYARNLKVNVHVDYNGRGIVDFDGALLSSMPKRITDPPPQFEQLRKRRKVVRRKK